MLEEEEEDEADEAAIAFTEADEEKAPPPAAGDGAVDAPKGRPEEEMLAGMLMAAAVATAPKVNGKTREGATAVIAADGAEVPVLLRGPTTRPWIVPLPSSSPSQRGGAPAVGAAADAAGLRRPRRPGWIGVQSAP